MADILKKEMLLEKWDYMIFSQDNSPYGIIVWLKDGSRVVYISESEGEK